MSDNPELLDITRRASLYTIQPQFWESEAEPRAVYGPDHGHFYGHHHSYTQGLMGLLWYADAANDPRIKAFVRDSYEYMRNFGIARIGLFGEGCTTGDMVWLALKLSDAGVGDYYDDADCYLRNHLAELQITSADKLRTCVETMPKNVRGKFEMLKPDVPFDPINESRENVIERNVGIFLGDSTHPTLIPEHTFLYTICCTGNLTPAMYYAWESIVRCQDGGATVNLLLNRASNWLDVDSYLPYEGKVVIRNKSARALSVRIPRWVDKDSVRSSIDDQPASPYWTGRYLVFTSVKPGNVVTINFPMVESTEKYTLLWKQREFWLESTKPGTVWTPDPDPSVYTCTFRGNTLVDITPRDMGLGYPVYQRDKMKTNKPPMKDVKRFISKVLVDL